MKKLFGLLAIVLWAMHLLVGMADAAAITNGSFEQEDLTPWYTDKIAGGSVKVVTSAIAYDKELYLPREGKSMAQLTATSYLSQTFSWKTGDTLTFDWAFLGFEKREFIVDIASFSITAPSDKTLLFSTTLGTGSTIDSGWKEYAYKFESASTGTIQFSSVNGGVNQGHDSILLVDNFRQTTSPVPIPGSALLLGSGLLGLLGISSRRNRA